MKVRWIQRIIERGMEFIITKMMTILTKDMKDFGTMIKKRGREQFMTSSIENCLRVIGKRMYNKDTEYYITSKILVDSKSSMKDISSQVYSTVKV